MDMNEKLMRRVFFFVATAAVTNAFYFTYLSAIPLVKSDGWRFIELYLEPWFQGTLDWRTLWNDFHPQPVTALLFIANAQFFGLKMNYEALFSLVFAPLILLVIVKRIRASFPQSSGRFAYLVALISALLVMSLTSTAVYTWSLVTKGFITTFVAVLAVSFVDFRLSRCDARGVAIGLPFFTVFLVLFGDLATIFVASCLLVLGLSFLIERKVVLLCWVAVIACAKVLQLFFMHLIAATPGYLGELSIDLANYFFAYLSYIGVGLLSAWINLRALVGIPLESFPYLGGVFLLFYSLVLVIYFARGWSNITILPGVFILVAMLTGVGGALIRFDPDNATPLSGLVPRYYLQYFLGAIGVVWICFLELGRAGARSRAPIWIAVGFSTVVFLGQILSSVAAWRSVPSIVRSTEISCLRMAKNANGDLSEIPPRYMIGGNYPKRYLNGLSFLKKRRLNLFSGSSGVPGCPSEVESLVLANGFGLRGNQAGEEAGHISGGAGWPGSESRGSVPEI